MEVYRKQVEEAAAFISHNLEFRPTIGLILGTGLGERCGCNASHRRHSV